MKTVGDIIDGKKGIGPGFDTLRLVLSLSILLWHSVAVSYGRQTEIAVWRSPWATPVTALLPVFFALSGFLVMGSALRAKALKPFLMLRALRIVPALSTEITLSALLLGSTFTELPLRVYFTRPDFFTYFGSLIGRIRISLPGVFVDNPFPNVVNVSLWTIAPELLCYVFLAMMMFVGFLKSRYFTSAVVLALFALNVWVDFFGSPHQIGDALQPRSLILCFALGNCAYIWRHRLPYSLPLFVVSATAGLFLINHRGFEDISLVFLTYCLVFLGVTSLPRLSFLSRGDYSYGIYLYAFPVQQAVAHLLPEHREFMSTSCFRCRSSWVWQWSPGILSRSRRYLCANASMQMCQPTMS